MAIHVLDTFKETFELVDNTYTSFNRFTLENVHLFSRFAGHDSLRWWYTGPIKFSSSMETSLTISRYNCLARIIFMPPCRLPQLQYRQAEKQFCKAHLFLHFSKSQIMKQGRKNAMYLMLQTTHPLDVSQCRTPPPGLMPLFLVNCHILELFLMMVTHTGALGLEVEAGR